MALSTETEPPRPCFEALLLRATDGWFAYLIPLVSLPLSPNQKPAYQETLQRLVKLLRGSSASHRTVILELEELHKNDAIRQIGANGRIWGPEFGLGVRPEQSAPKFWKFEDMIERPYDQPIPPLMLSVVRLDTDEAGAGHAAATMAGTGGLLQAIHRDPIDQLVSAWKQVLLPPIQEDGLRAFPLYVPLLTAESVTHSAEMLNTWLGSVDIYLRESPQDKGLLVVSREALEHKLVEAGIDIPLPPSKPALGTL
jgi:hypothetical protein